MKAHSKVIVVVALLLVAAFSLHAQNKNVEVKILPSLEKGFIKVLFVTDNSSDVQVKFYNPQGLYTTDFVKKNAYEKGFLKKYDIRKVQRGESFWIEVSSKDVVTTYKITASESHIAYEPQLERTEYVSARVASKD